MKQTKLYYLIVQDTREKDKETSLGPVQIVASTDKEVREQLKEISKKQPHFKQIVLFKAIDYFGNSLNEVIGMLDF